MTRRKLLKIAELRAQIKEAQSALLRNVSRGNMHEAAAAHLRIRLLTARVQTVARSACQ